jgi:hypothetical protein
MTTRLPLLAALCGLALLAGCGDDDGPPSSRQITTVATPRAAETTPTDTVPAEPESIASEDKRGIALQCIRDRMGIEAVAVGDKTIQVGPGNEGPRIDFFQSSLEAEGEQFEGRAEGAEQIGAALLYVREASEDQLVDLEECLNEQ